MAAPREDGLESAVPTAPPSALGSADRLFLGIKMWRLMLKIRKFVWSSVPDPLHFESDPDP